jgi:DNA polymerase III sliding clamp (beta) subunit (PCNA family)
MLLLPRNLAKLVDIATRDPGRISMTGIRVLEYADGYRLEATDGRRLLIVRGPNNHRELTPQERLTLASLEDAPNDIFNALVPGEDWAAAFRAAKKAECVGLALGEVDVTFAAGSQLLKTRQVEGRFPDVDAVLPKREPLWSIAVNPQLLAGLLTAMAQIAGEDGRRVVLHYYGAKDPLGISCMNAEGQFGDALLVPLL